VLLTAADLRADDDLDEELPIPTSVEAVHSTTDRMAEEREWDEKGLYSWLRHELQETPPVFRDTKLDLRLRTIYSRRGNYGNSTNEAWAIGGSLSYQSGWLYDRLGIGAALYTSQPVYAPTGNDGSGLLASGQKGYTVLGQLYGRVKLMDATFLNLYRYGEYNTPYLSKSDSKMTPYTYEGYTIAGRLGGTEGSPRLDFDGGYLLKIKDKTAENFIWMSEKAGVKVDRGVAMFGARYSQAGFSLAAIDYFCDDVINIGYAETTYTARITKELGARVAVQFTDQRSVGSNLLYGRHFATSQVGVKSDVSYSGAMLSLAYTANDDGADLVKPWSGYPGYTGAMVSDYNKAGVKAIYVRLSYDFGRVGLTGVAGYAAYAHGWGMVSAKTGISLPNENEYDADLEWRPSGMHLSGFWVRLRYGVVHQYQGPEQYIHDARVTMNYDLPLL
jgi:hypothetical protein